MSSRESVSEPRDLRTIDRGRSFDFALSAPLRMTVVLYQNALATSSSRARMDSFWGHSFSHWPQPRQASALFSMAA